MSIMSFSITLSPRQHSLPKVTGSIELDRACNMICSSKSFVLITSAQMKPSYPDKSNRGHSGILIYILSLIKDIPSSTIITFSRSKKPPEQALPRHRKAPPDQPMPTVHWSVQPVISSRTTLLRKFILICPFPILESTVKKLSRVFLMLSSIVPLFAVNINAFYETFSQADG